MTDKTDCHWDHYGDDCNENGDFVFKVGEVTCPHCLASIIRALDVKASSCSDTVRRARDEQRKHLDKINGKPKPLGELGATEINFGEPGYARIVSITDQDGNEVEQVGPPNWEALGIRVGDYVQAAYIFKETCRHEFRPEKCGPYEDDLSQPVIPTEGRNPIDAQSKPLGELGAAEINFGEPGLELLIPCKPYPDIDRDLAATRSRSSIRRRQACIRGDIGGAFEIVIVPSLVVLTGYSHAHAVRNPLNNTLWTDVELFDLVPDPGGQTRGVVVGRIGNKSHCSDCNGRGEIHTKNGFVRCIKCRGVTKP